MLIFLVNEDASSIILGQPHRKLDHLVLSLCAL